MSQPTQNNAGAVVIDANILISICSKEPTEATAPNGDAALLVRAEEIRRGYSCLHYIPVEAVVSVIAVGSCLK